MKQRKPIPFKYTHGDSRIIGFVKASQIRNVFFDGVEQPALVCDLVINNPTYIRAANDRMYTDLKKNDRNYMRENPGMILGECKLGKNQGVDGINPCSVNPFMVYSTMGPMVSSTHDDLLSDMRTGFMITDVSIVSNGARPGSIILSASSRITKDEKDLFYRPKEKPENEYKALYETLLNYSSIFNARMTEMVGNTRESIERSGCEPVIYQYGASQTMATQTVPPIVMTSPTPVTIGNTQQQQQQQPTTASTVQPMQVTPLTTTTSPAQQPQSTVQYILIPQQQQHQLPPLPLSQHTSNTSPMQGYNQAPMMTTGQYHHPSGLPDQNYGMMQPQHGNWMNAHHQQQQWMGNEQLSQNPISQILQQQHQILQHLNRSGGGGGYDGGEPMRQKRTFDDVEYERGFSSSKKIRNQDQDLREMLLSVLNGPQQHPSTSTITNNLELKEAMSSLMKKIESNDHNTTMMSMIENLSEKIDKKIPSTAATTVAQIVEETQEPATSNTPETKALMEKLDALLQKVNEGNQSSSQMAQPQSNDTEQEQQQQQQPMETDKALMNPPNGIASSAQSEVQKNYGTVQKPTSNTPVTQFDINNRLHNSLSGIIAKRKKSSKK